jgi:Fanconi anemia group M protein
MPLFIDDREPDEIVRHLKKLNLAVEIKHIESGDYVFGDVAIERKTIADLVNSVTSGDRRFWTQLDTMRRTYQQPILLIEDWDRVDYEDRLTMGIITTVILFWRYQTIFSMDKKDTVDWIATLFTKYGVGKTGRIPPAAVIRAITPKEIRWAMLQCIAGVGPKTATKILEEIPDIFSGLFNPYDLKNYLTKVKGLKKESLELLIKVKSNDV